MIQAVSWGFKLAVTKQNSPYDCKENSCHKSVTSTTIPPPTVFLPLHRPHNKLPHSGAASEKVIAETHACVLVRVHQIVTGDPAPGDASMALSAVITMSCHVGTGHCPLVCGSVCWDVHTGDWEHQMYRSLITGITACILSSKRGGGKDETEQHHLATGITKMAFINKRLKRTSWTTSPKIREEGGLKTFPKVHTYTERAFVNTYSTHTRGTRFTYIEIRGTGTFTYAPEEQCTPRGAHTILVVSQYPQADWTSGAWHRGAAQGISGLWQPALAPSCGASVATPLQNKRLAQNLPLPGDITTERKHIFTTASLCK